MEENKKQEVALDCLNKARNYFKENNVRRAFPHYLMCLELQPTERNTYKEEFCQVLCDLGNLLEAEELHQHLFDCYEKALYYFPTEFCILNNFGAHLLRLGHPDAALTYFEKACKTSPTNLLAEKNLQTCKLGIIPRWHFRMLNDSTRNLAYRTAIRSATANRVNVRVVDIGAGCGLLSHYVSECKSVKKAIAIESNPILAGIAESLLDRVEVICKNSTELRGSELGPINLIVTEIFDAGLFGEHALETLIHAWDNLAVPLAQIIPASADLFIGGINSDFIFAKHKLINGKQHCIKLDTLCVVQNREEPYEAENLKITPCDFLTESKKVLNVRFSDVEQLRSLHDGKIVSETHLKCTKSGFVQAFAVYFDLYLNGDIRITTNPNEDSLSCWEQAIVYLDHPLSVLKDQEISVSVSCSGGKLEVTANVSRDYCTQCFSVSQQSVAFLNDARLCEISKSNLTPGNYCDNVIRMIDLNPFPTFALQAARSKQCGEYIVLAKTEDDRAFLQSVLALNGFIASNRAVSFKIYNTFLDVCQQVENNSVDVIFINPVSINGTLCEETFDNLQVLKQFLKREGQILPKKIKLVMELIDSDYLDYCNKVKEENCGFRVGKEMNKYAISEQWQVNIETYNRKTLGNTQICEFSDFTDKAELTRNRYHFKITTDGVANGILCWYDLIFSDNLHLNTSDSFYYKGMCYIFDKVYSVKKNDVLEVNLTQENGLLKINIPN